MAIGPGIYFDRFKGKNIDELKKTLKELKSQRMKEFLKAIREQQIKFRVDDGNAESDNQTQIEVIETLIKYFTMYPYSNISQCDNYWSIQNAVKFHSGQVNQKEEMPNNNRD